MSSASSGVRRNEKTTAGDLLTTLLFAAVVPATINAGIRMWLRWSRRDGEEPASTSRLSRILVVIPSRSEGEAVRATLESVLRATSRVIEERTSRPLAIETLLLLDGDDPAAAAIARELGARVIVKTPAGPTKAAALAWLATTMRDVVQGIDAVLLLDVRSRLSPAFFSALRWPDGVDGVQAILSGEGKGVGEAVARSERLAQQEDAARVAKGWSARVRGTGTLLTPAAFLRVMPELRTRIEDTETTLLMMARGERIALAAENAMVFDEKPQDVAAAARQRTRWISGQVELFTGRRTDWMQLIARNPAEGVDFACELASKPRSLFLPLRLAASVALLFLARRRGSAAWTVAAVAVGSTTIVDTVFWASDPRQWKAAGDLFASWLRAAALAPTVAKRWMRAGEP